jgi:hypothetical protein
VPSGLEGTALVASLSYSTYQLKLEGMLSKAFQLAGLDVVVAVPQDGDIPRRLLQVFGIERFVSLQDFLHPRMEHTAKREAEQLLASVEQPSDLKTVTFRGADVGRQVLSTVSRYLHEGAVDLGGPRARSLLEELLPKAIATTLASEAMLDEIAPDLVLFNERNYADLGPMSDVALARDLNVIQFVSGFEDDTLVFMRYTQATKALHPRAITDEAWPGVVAMRWTPERDAELDADFVKRYDGSTFLARWNQGWTRPRTRAELVADLGLSSARRTVVVFSHVLWDANMFYGRDLFSDQEEWFVETVRAACANDRVNWVVKLHPANVWKLRRDRVDEELDEHAAIRRHIGELPPHVVLLDPDTEISTRSLFDVTDVGVTIRGSVGFELPCFGKPALTAGTGFYSGRGFTIDSATSQEYLARLARIEEAPPPGPQEVELARKHAWALFRARQARFTSFRSVFQDVEHVDRPAEATIEIALRTPEELQDAEDLQRLGAWAVDSRALDYLELPLP